MAMIDSVYQYYLTTYGTDHSSRYDSHKKSELRNTYNSIVKSNNESPLYKIKDSGDVKKFAIDIKESARNIKNVIASLSDGDGSITNAFQKKVAVSDQDDIVSAEYIGNGSQNENTSSFQIEVKNLATPQTNTGHYLKKDHLDLTPGSYSFDLATSQTSYEFQFNVSPDDTNRTIQDKLAKLINNAGIGLHAEVLDGDKNDSTLEIQSKRTGLSGSESSLFDIMPQTTSSSIEAMDVLGINRVSSPAQNSNFLLNGKERSSYSNTFTINNAFELNLKGISKDGSAATVGFKANADAIADNIEELTNAYNTIINTARNYSGTNQNSNKLLSDMGNVAKRYESGFAEIGLSVDDDALISVDRDKLKEAVTADGAEESFSILNRFKNSLSAKANQASINPMNYVDKVVVAYKNPGHNFSTPYITSIYSGMLVDQAL